MIHENDIELIEKYLSGELTKEEEIIFNKKNAGNYEFSEEVQFRENLKVAAERLVSAEFKATFDNIHAHHVNKKRRTKQIYLYSIISISAAALVLLFFLLGNPLSESHKLENYIADAGGITTLSIPNISDVSLKSPENAGHSSYAELQVSFIGNKDYRNMHDQYFFNEEVLYLFQQSTDTINLFYTLEGEGDRVYYLCRNKHLFRIEQLEENTLFYLQPVSDIEMGNYCR